ncbi:serine/threonine-protein kinase [Rhizomonospora bruguierae]|uniref:serine/threonine-protein kinase n=1 Tax=Rhizomonospora bruguierae TaxID=1581705 RepID=UPI0020BEE44E|nr:serine/threonine-protein kinase [Micromonospora sp. NBRC 107566]
MTQIPTTWSATNAGPPAGRAAPGSTIGGRYALRAAVGTGGMGTVWRASDTLLRRDVAVKEVVLPPGLAPSDRDSMYERTLREARAAAALAHPSVVQVYDVVTEAGRPWIVMELLDARSLADMVIEDGPLAPRAVAKIGIALLGALEVAHAAGVLHRDVKPANVLICSDGRCVLTDFGVARMPTDVQLTTPGMVLGSPHFISPERAMGSDFGPPSDLFSLGVTLYTAVEGRPPFDKGDPIETMHAVVEDPPAPPVRAGALGTVLFGLLEKDPAKRWEVGAARATLRDLIVGPLASKAPTNTWTDPYSVVPAQRAPVPAEPPAPQPTGQIGGRAMLQPGESLTDRLAQVKAGPPAPTSPAAGTAPASPAAAGAAGPTTAAWRTAPDVTAPVPTAGDPAATTQRWNLSAGQAAPQSPQPFAPQPFAPPPAGHTQPFPPQPFPPQPAGHTQPFPPQPFAPPPPGHTQPAGAYPPPHGPHHAPQYGQQPWSPYPPLPGQQPGGAGAKSAGARLVGAVRGWPTKVRIGAAAGAAVLLLGIIGLASLGGGGDEPAVAGQITEAPSSATAAPAAFPVQQHSAKGIALNVPKGWERKAPEKASYVDYVDPDNAGRKVRILVENSNAEPNRFLVIAENYLRDKSTSCPDPYERRALSTAELDGRPAAELEYTCGAGDDMRHGVWRAVVTGGKAYSFYLTTSESQFDESRPIFEEMVRSFKFDAA